MSHRLERPAISHCAVVIPARNEEKLLPRCLAAVAAARARLASARPDVAVQVVLVLDRCHDGSAEIAERAGGVTVLHIDATSVGAARHLGCQWALDAAPGPAAASWLACTDADSAVPADWLTWHLEQADDGADVVLGTVIPDHDEMLGTPFDRWLDSYPQSDDHTFIHGANLGVRGDVYIRTGGFRAVLEHEDVRLVQAARRLGARVSSTADCAVITSGRHVGRTPGGFAGWMSTRHDLESSS